MGTASGYSIYRRRWTREAPWGWGKFLCCVFLLVYLGFLLQRDGQRSAYSKATQAFALTCGLGCRIVFVDMFLLSLIVFVLFWSAPATLWYPLILGDQTGICMGMPSACQVRGLLPSGAAQAHDFSPTAFIRCLTHLTSRKICLGQVTSPAEVSHPPQGIYRESPHTHVKSCAVFTQKNHRFDGVEQSRC